MVIAPSGSGLDIALWHVLRLLCDCDCPGVLPKPGDEQAPALLHLIDTHLRPPAAEDGTSNRAFR